MSRNVDLSGVQIGDATVLCRHGDGETEPETVTIEATIGGVHGNRITVTADWWDEHTPEPTP